LRLIQERKDKEVSMSDGVQYIKCGVGFVGSGTPRPYETEDSRRAYNAWYHMMERCYSDKLRYKYPSYSGCTVAEEWHCFQTFADWWFKNYRPDYDLDKDLLSGSMYSTETCVFLPKRINILLAKHTTEGKIPGVSFYSGKWNARVSTPLQKGKKYLGRYEKIEDAEEAVKSYFISIMPAIKNWIIKYDIEEEIADLIIRKVYHPYI